jgi:hypothetical protein
VNLSLDAIVGIIRIGGSAFRRFGDGGSEVAFLIAGFRRLSALTLLLFSLSSGLVRGC